MNRRGCTAAARCTAAALYAILAMRTKRGLDVCYPSIPAATFVSTRTAAVSAAMCIYVRAPFFSELCPSFYSPAHFNRSGPNKMPKKGMLLGSSRRVTCAVCFSGRAVVLHVHDYSILLLYVWGGVFISSGEYRTPIGSHTHDIHTAAV